MVPWTAGEQDRYIKLVKAFSDDIKTTVKILSELKAMVAEIVVWMDPTRLSMPNQPNFSYHTYFFKVHSNIVLPSTSVGLHVTILKVVPNHQ